MSERQRSASHRLGVITIDEIVGGASNVLAAVLAARMLSVGSFGLFGIVFLVYVLLIGVTRALVNDPVLVHPHDAETRPAEIIATNATLSIGLGVLMAVGALGIRVFEPVLGDALLVLAACLPLLALQDLGRYLGFATHRPVRALVLDSVWLVLMVATVIVLVVAGDRTLVWFMVAWGGSGAASGLLLFWQHQGVRFRLGLSWLRTTWSFSWRYLVSYIATQSAPLAAAGSVGGIVGARGLGAVQGTVLLVRPFGTFQTAAVAAGVSEVSRAPEDHPLARRHALRTTGLTTILAVINAAILVELPNRLGIIVLGATWHVTKPLLVPTGLQIICLGVLTGARASMLGMRKIRRAMYIDVAGTAMFLAATIAGAIANGALGALWAVAISQGLLAVVWWFALVGSTSGAQSVPGSGAVGEVESATTAAVTASPPLL